MNIYKDWEASHMNILLFLVKGFETMEVSGKRKDEPEPTRLYIHR